MTSLEEMPLVRQVEVWRGATVHALATQMKLALWILRHYDGQKDHACIQCEPSGESVREDFQCAYHLAKALLPNLNEALT